MANQSYLNTGYTLGQSPLTTLAPNPVVSPSIPGNPGRAPTVNDNNYPIGQQWVYKKGGSGTGSVYFLASIAAGIATWIQVSPSGGSGTFTTLTVTGQSTLGATTIVGTTLINDSGSSVTTIGTGGTGAVNIGNATGNTAVTGTLTTSGALTVTTGGLTVSAGGAAITGDSTVTGTLGATGIVTVASAITPVTAGSILQVLGGGGAAPSIVISAGVPSVTAGINKGSIAINNAATTASTRLYIFDGAAWQAFTAAG